MVLTNIKNARKESGFTIVELLVVIVVIGILAAITIVSYVGISNKAKSAQAQSNAASVDSIIQTMVAEDNNNLYPSTLVSIRTNAGVAKLPGGLLLVSSAISAANGLNTVSYSCNSAAAGVGPCLGTGGRITYWDFSTGTKYIYEGVATASSFFFSPAT